MAGFPYSLNCSNCGHSFGEELRSYPPTSPSMLRSGISYSDSQRASFRKNVVDIQNAILRREQEMGLLKAAILKADRETQDLRKALASYQALVAPIRRIPSELLSEIFKCCLIRPACTNMLISGAGDPKFGFHDEGIPLRLSSVCSHWRATALITPQLWTTISSAPDHHHTLGLVTMAKTWIERSDALPLDISIEYYYHSEERLSSRPNYTIVDVVIPHSDRWCTVFLALFQPQYAKIAAIKGRLPTLKALEIHHVYSGEGFSSTSEDDVFSIAPNLQSFSFFYGDHPSRFILPWQILRSCTIASASSAECVKILQQCSSLTECNMYCTGDRGDLVSLQPKSLIFSSLQTLKLQINYQWEIRNLLPAIVCPALRELHLFLNDEIYTKDDPDEEVEHESIRPELSSLLSTTEGNVQVLRLVELTIEEDELLLCLTMTPNLVEFELSEFHARLRGFPTQPLPFETLLFTPAVLDRLTFRFSNLPILIPQLKCLRIGMGSSVDEERLMVMLESRWRPQHSIEAVDDIDPSLPSFLERVKMNLYYRAPTTATSLNLKAAQWIAEGNDIRVRYVPDKTVYRNVL